MVKEPIDAEEVGALLDGTADEERRNALLARLATADEDYELFADTAAVLREIEEEAVAPALGGIEETATPIALEAGEAPSLDVPVAPEIEAVATPAAGAGRRPETTADVIPLRPRRPSVWTRPATRWLAAAAVVATVAVPVIRARPDRGRDPARLTVLALNGERPPAGWDVDSLRAWPILRGGGDAPRGIPVAGASAKVGTLHTDLEAVARAPDPRDTAAVRRFADDAEKTLKDIDQTTADGVATQYHLVATSAAAPRPQLLSTLRTARKQAVEAIDPDYFEAGAWAEAARLAVLRHKESFFRARESAGALERAASLPRLSEEGKHALEQLTAIQRGGEIQDWNAVGDVLHSFQQELVRAQDPEQP